MGTKRYESKSVDKKKHVKNEGGITGRKRESTGRERHRLTPVASGRVFVITREVDVEDETARRRENMVSE